ncbi:hypothetical protein CBQ28_15535 [Pseudoalteromonas sp. GCY]|uniref:non-ribosomal peptide synthetase n=1 Tax=Pseudoalteromonas sp. GCY TaxID=2003316 RepID=UPI000BFEE8DF|nr:non-ribosomal peptide synthetase [Pseudoalteromonas sp. GCY]PHI36205.1 hypothetical protein CBQ28_15535 [Pseudoalteromonas sp. GCY]QQQ65438.1 non-ribosomal peptide synthetase [Pseudoalteromonas sp. GCY]
MTLEELIDWCIDNDVTIQRDGENIKFSGNTDALNTTIVATIKSVKEELVTWLKEQEYKQSLEISVRNYDGNNLVPASFAQQRLWFTHKLDSDGNKYNLNEVVGLEGTFELAVANQIFTHLIERHDTVRTVFVEQDGELYQRLLDKPTFNIDYIDLRSVEPTRREQTMREQIEAELNHAFKLDQDLMLRVSYYHLEEGRGVLHCVIHHIAADGWSLQLLMNEFQQSYSAAITGVPYQLEPLPVCYRDYALWQKEYLTQTRLSQSLEYWRQQLEDAPAQHSIPLDFARGQSTSAEGAGVSFHVPEQVTNALEKIASENGASLYMVLHSVISLLIARYGDSDEVVIGSPHANRDNANLAGLVGFFVNTLALRSDCSGNPSFLEFLLKNREMILAAQSHHHVPFDVLVEKLNPSRSTTLTPFFQIAFAMEFNNSQMTQSNSDTRAGSLGLNTFAVEQENKLASYELTFRVTRGADGLFVTLEYNTGVFTQDTIEQLARGFETLLCALTPESLSQSIRTLPILSEVDKSKIECLIQGDGASVVSEQLVHEQFTRVVKQFPEAVAISDESEELSYQVLDSKANQIANFLRSVGVSKGEHIAIFMERSCEMALAKLAVLKSGAAYLSIEPNYPEERRQHILAEAQPKLVLTQEHLQGELDGVLAISVSCDFDGSVFESASESAPEVDIAPEDTAYVIFTSGSTGKPKGVINTHRGLANLVSWHKQRYDLDSTCHATMLASIGFDAAVWELWPNLCSGAQLHCVSDVLRVSEGLFLDYLSEYQITHSFLPTALYEAIAEKGLFNSTSLRYVFVGGEALTKSFIPQQCQFSVVNHYGPTEAAVVTTSCDVIKGSRQTPAIGHAIDNVITAVMDEYGELMPLGCTGELYIGGAGLASGYLNNQELTSQMFVDTPYGRMYRSGDYVHYDKHKQHALRFDYRKDSQVKIRGVRIELNEINNVLIDHLAVSAAVTIIQETPDLGKELVAYVVANDCDISQSILASVLRNDLKAKLSAHMLPSVFIKLSVLPKTHHGKIDFRALPLPQATDRVAEYQAAQGDTENALVTIWSELLNLSESLLGRNARFFDLGGHSLLSIQMVNRIEEALGKRITVQDIFESDSLATLAEVIDKAEAGGESIPVCSRELNEFPLSYAQQRLWFIEESGQGGIHYNIPVVSRVDGQLDKAVFDQAFQILFERHEILRMTFHNTPEGPRQVIQPPTKFSVEHVWPSDEEALSDKALRRLINETIEHTFNLSEELPIRVKLIHLNHTSAVLVMNLHHIITDGWSTTQLLKEFMSLYKTLSNGDAPELPEMGIQYVDYATWLRAEKTTNNFDEQLDYWRVQLDGIPASHSMPLDYKRPTEQTFSGGYTGFVLDRPVTDSLYKLAQKTDSSLFMIMHAALSILLAKYSKQTDIVVGTSFANRDNKQLEPLIGFFVNEVVLRTKVDWTQSFCDFLKSVKQVNSEAQKNADVPFEYLVEKLNPARDASVSPLFQIALNLNSQSLPDREQQNIKLSRLDDMVPTAKFDLTFNVDTNHSDLMLALEFNTDLFKPETIEYLAQSWGELLASIAKNSECSLGELNLVNQEEYRQLTVGANNRFVPHRTGMTIHQQVSSWSVKTPNKTAVCDDNSAITYRELDEQSDIVAMGIAARGIKPGSRVIISMSRGVELIVGILGILKAGAIYVPVDTNAPAQRVQYLLHNSGAEVIVTDRAHSANFENAVCVEIETLLAESSEPQSRVVHDVTPDSSAYIIYTSGSTGKPKGVVQSHNCVSSLISATRQQFQFDPSDVWSMTASYAFDASVWEIFGALLNGATLAIPTFEQVRDPQAFLDFSTRYKVTNWCLTVSLFRLVSDYMLTYNRLPETLNYIVLCGEATQTHSLRKWWNTFSEDKPTLINMYGITETTVHSTFKHLRPSSIGRSNIGVALADQVIYLLDEQLQPVPRGAVGEIFVAGARLAKEYWNNDRTRSVFIENPYASEQMRQLGYDRMYKSGDLARILENGELDYCGRQDQQIKFNGFRIELGEVESAMLSVPGIDQAVAFLSDLKNGEKQLVAAYVSASGTDSFQIRQALFESLPVYLIPNVFFKLGVIPKNISGKVDFEQLSVLAPKEAAKEYIAPEGEIEQRVSALWSQLLDITQDKISRYDNFFELGGHSMLAIQLLGEINSYANMRLTIQHIFQYPVLVDFCQFLEVSASLEEPVSVLEGEEEWL